MSEIKSSKLEEVVENYDLTEAEAESLLRDVLGEAGEEEEDEGLAAKISRRNFLKMLGLGATGLAMTSQGLAGLFKLKKNSAPDALNADTVDGSDLTDLAGNQLSASGGSLDVKEGSGSGLDADTVDGKHASELGGQFTHSIGAGRITGNVNLTQSWTKNYTLSTNLDSGPVDQIFSGTLQASGFSTTASYYIKKNGSKVAGGPTFLSSYSTAYFYVETRISVSGGDSVKVGVTGPPNLDGTFTWWG